MLTQADFENKALQIADDIFPFDEPPSHGNITALAAQLYQILTAHSSGAQGEPVAEVESWTNGSYHRNYKLRWFKDVEIGTKLYAHPQPMPQAQPVYDKSVVRRLATQWGMIPETAAARDALAEIITARKAMLKRIDDVHTADRQTGCNTFYDNDLERHTAILFRAIDAEIERIEREGEA